jgi:hypothetical protein
METFVQWLQGEDRRTVSPHQQDFVPTPAATSEEVETHQQPEPAPQRATTPATDDIEILTQKFGELRSGMTIRMELNEACELLGRTRKRIDAFKTLAKRLKDEYGVQLIIYSQKTHV